MATGQTWRVELKLAVLLFKALLQHFIFSIGLPGANSLPSIAVSCDRRQSTTPMPYICDSRIKVLTL